MIKNDDNVLEDIRNGKGLQPIEDMYTIEIPNSQKFLKLILEGRGKSHWISDPDTGSITCSNCNCEMWANDLIDGDAHYCPNCGSLMWNR